MTHRYVLLWNAPRMLSADEDQRWVERELEQLRASTPSLDMTCVQTASDDGPGWMLEISIGDGYPASVPARIRDFGWELHSLRLRPRSFVAGPGVSRDSHRAGSSWRRIGLRRSRARRPRDG